MQTHSDSHKRYSFKLALRIIISVIVVEFLGSLPSIFAMNNINSWYAQLNKPIFNPPNWLFGLAWGFLFLLLGIALGLIWHKTVIQNTFLITGRRSIKLFFFHLLFNMLWIFLFLGLQMPSLALAEIFILIILIVLTIVSFKKVNKLSAHLLIPYLFWVCFATVLNASIVNLN